MDTDADDKVQARSSGAKLARQVEANDIKWLMANKQGRRIVWRLLAEAGVYRSSFTGNSETFFREGKREIGLFLLREITNHCAEAYVLMLSESKAPA